MTDSTIELRRGTHADAEAILQVSLDAILTSASGHYDPEQLSAWASRRTLSGHRQMLEQTILVVALIDSQIVGFGNLIPERCLVDQLFVSPQAGGRGVARALLTSLAGAAVAARLPHVEAHASWRAVGAFERLGYERVATESVQIGDQTLGRVLVRLQLTAPGSSGEQSALR